MDPDNRVLLQVTLDDAAAAGAIETALARGAGIVDATTVWRVLGAYGLPLARSRFEPGTAADVAAAASQLGYPVALKAAHRRIGRSAQAGVALDLGGEAAVTEALEVMRASLGVDAEHVVVQEMVAPGADVRIRCWIDPVVGAVISVGPGSQQAPDLPSLDDGARLAPVTHVAAAAMIARSSVGTTLRATGADPARLADSMVRLSRLVVAHPQLTEIDVNPMIVGLRRTVVTDARIIVAASPPAIPAMRGLP